ncbi:MAG TPA: ROK family protein [Candidatus Aminicenantes bacterium]|nr:ROK family protein [Candidatus Aminicenantes bacterium]
MTPRGPVARPPCDPGFEPAVLAWTAYLDRARASGPVPLRLAVEREDGLISVFEAVAPGRDADPEATYRIVERAAKFLLWSRGGWRLHVQGPAAIGRRLKADYSETGPRAFDVRTMSGVYERPFEVALHSPATFPEPREAVRFPGGHLKGFRVGFDLGASDFKVAAVVDGEPVFSEEIPWAPGEQADPDYHYRHIQAGLKKAASHLPRVDAIGGSSAGIIIRNQVRVASLFRSVPPDLFEAKVKGLFGRLAAEWGVPFEVLNDGEVTALAGRLSLGETGVLGVAMGSSEAAGFLDPDGHIPGWLDELAFAPVDLSPGAPVDEWSGDRGVGANYFSQQAVGRLALAAGLSFPEGMRLPERLSEVQALMGRGDAPAGRVFESIGVYLGCTVPWYEVFYGLRNLLVLGRVLSGPGGKLIVDKAAEVLASSFPETAARVRIHLLDEKSRRVGQAVAAASVPEAEGAPR